MVNKIIESFKAQLEYQPQLENSGNFVRKENIKIVAMGGSHLPADLIKIANPDLSISVHNDYSVSFGENDLAIFVSQSGNTEEVISAFKSAFADKVSSAVISGGGELLKMAKDSGVAYVEIPDVGLRARFATIVMAKALMRLLEKQDDIDFGWDGIENGLEDMAGFLVNKIPVICSSSANYPLARLWTAHFQETAKAIAFSNFIPEANHNEMLAFYADDLSKNFTFIFLKDSEDHERILKRVDLTEKIYREKGYPVLSEDLPGSKLSKLVRSSIRASLAGLYLAEARNVDPDNIDLIDNFKKQL